MAKITIAQGGGTGRPVFSPFSGKSERPQPPIPRDFSFRCRADLSMPMNSAVREICPRKAGDLGHEILRSKISRASRSGMLMSFSPPARPVWSERAPRPRRAACRQSPPHPGRREMRIIRRSTLLRSWRTLPGQSCDWSTAIASSAMRLRGRPVEARDLLHGRSRSVRYVLRRSASDGMRIGTTLRRWNRSSRNRPGRSRRQVAARRGDDAHVDMHPGAAAER